LLKITVKARNDLIKKKKKKEGKKKKLGLEASTCNPNTQEA
jgi:hypothetical protein